MARARRRVRSAEKDAAATIRRVVELTTGLPEDSRSDAQLRDRLDLAADVLDASARAEEAGEGPPGEA